MSVLYTLAPQEVKQYVDANGAPYSGGKLYTKLVGTGTLATTYSTPTGTAHQNPIILNTQGYTATAGGATASVYLDAVVYDFYLTTSADVPVWGPLTVSSMALKTGVFDVFDFGGDSNSPVTATSYPSGTTGAVCHAGTGIWAIDADDIADGDYKLMGMLQTSDGIITATAALVNLSDGADTTPITTIASTSSSGASVTSALVTFATGGTSKNYAVKTKISATGYALFYGLKVIKVA